MTNASPPPAGGDWAKAVPRLAELTTDLLFGEIWERPELSKRDRSVVTVAVMLALFRTDQARSHMRRALDNGVTPEELSEIALQVAFYAGWPTGVNGAGILAEVLKSRAQ